MNGDWLEVTGWLLFAWSVGYGCGLLYLTLKKLGDAIV